MAHWLLFIIVNMYSANKPVNVKNFVTKYYNMHKYRFFLQFEKFHIIAVDNLEVIIRRFKNNAFQN